MAADVVTPFDRGLEQPRRPHRAEERHRRRRAAFVLRIGRAHSPAAKLDGAVDYFRATAKDHAVDQAQATASLERLERILIDAADALAKTIRRQR